MKGQNVPFRVKLPSQPTERVYHSRRPHRKSRDGCAKCKTRRVKCDETRPQCQKCIKLGLESECVYEAILPPGYGKSKNLERGYSEDAIIAQFLDGVPGPSPDGRAHSLAISAVSSQIDDVLGATQGKLRFKGCMGNLDTIKMFQDSITPTIISQNGMGVMRGKMIRLALESPYLMHSIVAVAIAHLRTALPDTETADRYTLLEVHHWQRAIRQYSSELQSSMGPKNMDPLFSACLLMTVNSFAMDSFNPGQSFMFSSNPAVSLNWLFVQSGLRHLLARSRPWVQKSMWWEMFMDSRNDLFDDTRPGREGLHPGLADLCGINEQSDETNPYFLPLRMLTPLLALEPSYETFPRITTFMGRLGPDFYERLILKDPPALVVLAWWLALMLGIKLWWVEKRARSECVAICMYLEDSLDPLVLKLLEFPASACNYVLKHVSLDVSLDEVLGASLDPIE